MQTRYSRSQVKYIFIGFITILIASCSGISREEPPGTQAEITQQEFVGKRTVTPNITTSATILPPSSTPAASKSPTYTPVSILPVYNLPSWMSDPDTNILAALITDDYKETKKISFINATTGEKDEILLPEDISGFFWYDNANFGFLSKALMTAYRIELRTGQVFTESVTSQEMRLLDQDWLSALELTKESSPGTTITFIEKSKNDNYTSKLFVAYWNDDNSAIVVYDIKTDQVIWESKPHENIYGTEVVWSPAKENYLAFLQGKPEPSNGFITESMSLTIVDVVQGKILSTYSGNFGMIRWSPDGKKILYQDPWSRYRNFGIGFTKAPCILYLETGVKRCLRAIPRIVPSGYILATTGVYRWGVDNKSIFYTYLYESQNELLGNLCIYSLVEGHITCPTQDLEVLHGRSIISYELSPNQQFIHFCYSASSILNDYADVANDGIIKIDGSGFFSWVGAIPEGGPPSCSYDTLWRPLP